MNESLNRAFIRAYDKEKSSEARRQVNAQKQQADELAKLMVQFDTATVDIPAPHMLQARRWPEIAPLAATQPAPIPAVAASSTRVAPAVSAPVGSPMPASDPQAVGDVVAHLSIEQQLQAFGWQEQAFPFYTSPIATPKPQPVRMSSQVPPNATPEPKAQELPVEPKAQMAPVEPIARTEPMSSAPVTPTTAGRISVPELDSLETPALSHSKHQPVVTDERPRQERGGSIFRLDRPSYLRDEQADTKTAETSPVRNYSDIEEDLSDSSETLWLDRTRIDLGTTTTAAPRQPSPNTTKSSRTVPNVVNNPINNSATIQRNAKAEAETRVLEEKLRNAKVRIFNPVWEVDSLQWPPVCIELMQRMSSSFKQIAENLAAACEEGLQIMAVTSPQRGEGTTTVACCLALLAGSHGLNVAIVDGDIEKPNLSYQTNLDVDQDWRGALLHNLSLEEIAVHSIDDQVTVVPLLNPISQQEMSPNDERIVNMMRELSASFDLVILDAGRVDSTRSLLTALGDQGLISAAVAVVDYRSSTPDRIEACLRRIRQSGIHSIGVVENFAA